MSDRGRTAARALYADDREVRAAVRAELGSAGWWADELGRRLDADDWPAAAVAARTMHDHTLTVLLLLTGRPDDAHP
jgi:hypothetical protein